jgi:hypothetical protein
LKELGERGLGFHRYHPRIQPVQGEGVIPDMRADVKTEIVRLDKWGVKPGEAAEASGDGVVGEEGAEQSDK